MEDDMQIHEPFNAEIASVDVNLDTADDLGDDESCLSSLFSVASQSSSISKPLRSAANSQLLNNFHYENNRRYHSYRSGQWMVPDDQREVDRMDITHQMMLILLNGELYLSPLIEPRRILDVGTGSGVWCAEVSFKYPNARIIGTDLSQIQVPPPANCTFEIEDADGGWLFMPNTFDLIHTRQLLGGISDWSAFFAKAYTSARPNGYVELHETPATLHSANREVDTSMLPMERAFDLYRSAMDLAGRPTQTTYFQEMMRDAGFVDVTETRYRIPIGPWTDGSREKEIGRYNCLNFLEGLESFLLAPLTRVLGMEYEEVTELCQQASANALNKKLKLWHELVVLRGRKPLSQEMKPPVLSH